MRTPKFDPFYLYRSLSEEIGFSVSHRLVSTRSNGYGTQGPSPVP